MQGKYKYCQTVPVIDWAQWAVGIWDRDSYWTSLKMTQAWLLKSEHEVSDITTCKPWYSPCCTNHLAQTCLQRSCHTQHFKRIAVCPCNFKGNIQAWHFMPGSMWTHISGGFPSQTTCHLVWHRESRIYSLTPPWSWASMPGAPVWRMQVPL